MLTLSRASSLSLRAPGKIKFLACTCNIRYSSTPRGSCVGMICPQCRSDDCYRSHRKGFLDYFCSVFGLRPWRCHVCDKRFYGRLVALNFARYAHCPRCGNFDLERISIHRVDAGTLVFLKRWLDFPAYRCDPCRLKFFSVLRPRRIMSSTAPVGVGKAVQPNQ